jgi:hypothetical protein
MFLHQFFRSTTHRDLADGLSLQIHMGSSWFGRIFPPSSLDQLPDQDDSMWIWSENASEPDNIGGMKVKSSEVCFATIGFKEYDWLLVNLCRLDRKRWLFETCSSVRSTNENRSARCPLIFSFKNIERWTWPMRISFYLHRPIFIETVSSACEWLRIRCPRHLIYYFTKIWNSAKADSPQQSHLQTISIVWEDPEHRFTIGLWTCEGETRRLISSLNLWNAWISTTSSCRLRNRSATLAQKTEVSWSMAKTLLADRMAFSIIRLTNQNYEKA